jgi:hypothetical protein
MKLHAGFRDPEVGGNMFLRNVGHETPDSTVSCLKSDKSS